MTPLQQKRHSECEATLQRAHEQRDDAVRKLVRVEARLQMAIRAKARLERALAKLVPSPVPVSVAAGTLLDAPKPATPPLPDDGIPDFLLRKKEAAAKDAAAVTAIKAEQAVAKTTKAKARIATMKAKAAGDTKRMPLTGREALNYLRTGSRA